MGWEIGGRGGSEKDVPLKGGKKTLSGVSKLVQVSIHLVTLKGSHEEGVSRKRQVLQRAPEVHCHASPLSKLSKERIMRCGERSRKAKKERRRKCRREMLPCLIAKVTRAVSP